MKYIGIPLNKNSDLRHGSDSSAEFNANAGGNISMWSESISKLKRQLFSMSKQEYASIIPLAINPASGTIFRKISGYY